MKVHCCALIECALEFLHGLGRYYSYRCTNSLKTVYQRARGQLFAFLKMHQITIMLSCLNNVDNHHLKTETNYLSI